MCPVNPKRRSRAGNFEARVESFVRTREAYKNPPKTVSMIISDRTTHLGPMLLGKGEFQGLIWANAQKMGHVEKLQNAVMSALHSRGVITKHFELTRVRSREVSKGAWVQEYFEKPTLYGLLEFFNTKKLKERVPFGDTKLSYEMCKKFAKNPKNAGVTPEKLAAAWKEFFSTCVEHSKTNIPSPESIVVIGVTREGKIKLGIVSEEKVPAEGNALAEIAKRKRPQQVIIRWKKRPVENASPPKK